MGARLGGGGRGAACLRRAGRREGRRGERRGRCRGRDRCRRRNREAHDVGRRGELVPRGLTFLFVSDVSLRGRLCLVCRARDRRRVDRARKRRGRGLAPVVVGRGRVEPRRNLCDVAIVFSSSSGAAGAVSPRPGIGGSGGIVAIDGAFSAAGSVGASERSGLSATSRATASADRHRDVRCGRHERADVEGRRRRGMIPSAPQPTGLRRRHMPASETRAGERGPQRRFFLDGAQGLLNRFRCGRRSRRPERRARTRERWRGERARPACALRRYPPPRLQPRRKRSTRAAPASTIPRRAAGLFPRSQRATFGQPACRRRWRRAIRSPRARTPMPGAAEIGR